MIDDFIGHTPLVQLTRIVPPGGGESYAGALRDRVLPALATLAALDRPTVLVSHAGIARVLLVALAGRVPADAVRTPIRQGEVLVFEAGRCRVA